MNLPSIKPHYQRFPVEVTTQQRGKTFILEVPARTASDAVDSVVNGGAREYGYYDWVSIACGSESIKRPPHRGGARTE